MGRVGRVEENRDEDKKKTRTDIETHNMKKRRFGEHETASYLKRGYERAKRAENSVNEATCIYVLNRFLENRTTKKIFNPVFCCLNAYLKYET